MNNKAAFQLTPVKKHPIMKFAKMKFTHNVFQQKNNISNIKLLRNTNIKTQSSCRCCVNAENKYPSHVQQISSYVSPIPCISGICHNTQGISGCILTTDASICCTDTDTDGSGCKDQNNICGIGGNVSLCNRTIESCSGGIVGEWDGWATSSTFSDDKPFCGDYSSIDYHVAVPWNLLCKEFRTKNCLANHMCPNCAKCGKKVGKRQDNNVSTGTDCSPGCSTGDCKGVGPMQVTSCVIGDERATCVGEACPSTKSHKNGIDEFGICWEVQPLDDPMLNSISKYKTNPEFPLYNYPAGRNINNETSTSDTYIIKLHDGCGGNCKGANSSCTGGVDCMNACLNNPAIYIDNCKITEHDSACNFMSTITKTDYTIDNISQLQTLQNMVGGTCALPYDVSTGNYQHPGQGIYTNWCSGAHMHFDFNSYNTILPTFVQNKLLRYRRVKCPKYADGCPTKTIPS